MKRTALALLTALALALTALPAGATPSTDDASPSDGALAPLHEAGGEAVPGSYIVVLEEGAGADVAAAVSVTPQVTFEHALQGFAASLDERQLEQVRRDPRVAYVEEDQVATLQTFVQQDPPWNLDRIDQRNLPLDDRYHWTNNAAGVDAYVFDTGIETSHPEFTHRAGVFYDAFGGNGQDCHGHGTHVAGTIGALTYGVAKTVKLWSVRVLNCYGSGTYAGIIAATDALRAHVTDDRPAIANYSLGGPHSLALNNAVSSLVNAGVFVTAAAGGSASNACNYSPAGATGVMTVGATDSGDTRAPFSNYGPCVELWAPGVNIASTWLGGGTMTISGTSMAAPHVAGAGAQVLADPNISQSPFDWLVQNATPRIDGNGIYLLLYKGHL